VNIRPGSSQAGGRGGRRSLRRRLPGAGAHRLVDPKQRSRLVAGWGTSKTCLRSSTRGREILHRAENAAGVFTRTSADASGLASIRARLRQPAPGAGRRALRGRLRPHFDTRRFRRGLVAFGAGGVTAVCRAVGQPILDWGLHGREGVIEGLCSGSATSCISRASGWMAGATDSVSCSRP
jgi:hypothetical protein